MKSLNATQSPASQRGISESVQWAILGNAFLLSLLAMVEVGLVWHGRSLAVEAALAGASAQSALRAPSNSGREVAATVATRGGLKNVLVQVDLSGSFVTVVVTGGVATGLGLVPVHGEATRPLEAS